MCCPNQNGHEDIQHLSHEQFLWTGVIKDEKKPLTKRCLKILNSPYHPSAQPKYHKATKTTFLHCIKNRDELQTNSTSITESSEGSKYQISKSETLAKWKTVTSDLSVEICSSYLEQQWNGKSMTAAPGNSLSIDTSQKGFGD